MQREKKSYSIQHPLQIFVYVYRLMRHKTLC